MKFKRSIILILLVEISFISYKLYPQENNFLSVKKVMLHYKRYFGTYIKVKGVKAEQEGSIFILEATLRQKKRNDKKIKNHIKVKFKSNELFINIQIEDEKLVKKVRAIKFGKVVYTLLEVKESINYNKRIPVFILQDIEVDNN